MSLEDAKEASQLPTGKNETEDAEIKLKIEIGVLVIKTLVDSLMSHDLFKAD